LASGLSTELPRPLGEPDPVRLQALTARFVPERLPLLRRGKRKFLRRGVEALAAVIEPNEEAEDLAYVAIGPSPLLLYELGGLYPEMMFLKPHYVAVTNRRVLLFRATRWSARPRSLVLADPRVGIRRSLQARNDPLLRLFSTRRCGRYTAAQLPTDSVEDRSRDDVCQAPATVAPGREQTDDAAQDDGQKAPTRHPVIPRSVSARVSVWMTSVFPVQL